MNKASDAQVGGGHYKDMVIQPAEYCQKNKLPFCESAVVKYVSRHREKNGLEDINKAIHFLELLKEFDYNENAQGLPSIEGSMGLDIYQFAAEEFAVYPTLGHPIVYPALGLAGEAGEVAEKVKKLMRDDGGEISDTKRQELKKELGDVLWYVAAVAREAGLLLSEVAAANLNKLAARAAQDMLGGSGDNREETIAEDVDTQHPLYAILAEGDYLRPTDEIRRGDEWKPFRELYPFYIPRRVFPGECVRRKL